MTYVHLRPTLAALTAVVLFSFGGLAIKWLSLAALPISGVRSALAALFLYFYLAHHSHSRSLPRIGRYGVFAAICYVVMTVSYVASMKLTTAANAIFLQYTMPAWVLIGGALWLNESITWGRLASIALSFTGMSLFFLGEWTPQQGLGNGLALLSGLGYALVALALRRDRRGNPVGAVFWGNALTAFLVVPVSFYFIPETLTQLTDMRSLLVLSGLGIFQIGLAYILFVSSLKSLPAVEVAILSTIEPVLNPLWVYLALGETPGRWAIIGGAIILLSALLRTLLKEESKSMESEAAV